MSASPVSPQLTSLLAQAERAAATADYNTATQLLASARALVPEHPLIDHTAGVLALRRGDFAEARACLERAVARDPNQPTYWLNLATTHRRLGNRAEESRCLQTLLSLDPRHLPGLLQKGSLLESEGLTKAAAMTYRNALRTIPSGARLPESLRGAVEHAQKVIRENNDALERLIRERLDPIRASTGGDAERADHCVEAFLDKRRIYSPQPTLLHFPKLPAWEYFPREQLPWLPQLEAAASAIREECVAVFAGDKRGLEPYIAYPEGLPLDQWAELNHSEKWSAFYLWRNGAPVEEHLERCPRTRQALESVPKVDIPGVSPNAFFSILAPHSHIPAHTGVTNTRATVHLPLVVPPGCRFRVGSDTRAWKVGTAWAFDDTIEHEAWNDSGEPRAILIFDVWNPCLTDSERGQVRAVVTSVLEHYGPAMALGGTL